MTRRRERRRKKLLDDIKDRRGYSHLKEEAVDRTMWRNRFGRCVRPVVRQNTELTNYSNFLKSTPRSSKICLFVFCLFSHQTTLDISLLPPACHMPCPPHPPSSYHLKLIQTQITEFLIMQLFSVLITFLPPRSKYRSKQRIIVITANQFMFL